MSNMSLGIFYLGRVSLALQPETVANIYLLVEIALSIN
jgi:hypothetical protein